MVEVPPDQIWMVVVGFLIAFILAFGIGANDVANSFGTSVGAKVLTLKQACIMASIFETAGAVLLGAKVSDTIRKGIVDISPYQNHTELLMVGNVAALSGSCVWLMAATMLRMPVSATHSIVGATVGFAMVAMGAKGINWGKLAMIIGSWFVSPVLAGAISTFLFYLLKFFILNKADPLEPGLRMLPLFYSLTIMINVFSVFYDGPEMLYMDRIPLWGTVVISVGAGIIVALLVKFAVVPWQRRNITEKCAKLEREKLKSSENQDEYAFVENELKKAQQENTCNEVALNGDDVYDKQNFHAMIEMEEKQAQELEKSVAALNQLNCNNHPTNTPPKGGANFIAPPTHSSGVLTNITHPAEDKTKTPDATPNNKNPKNKIDKKENASLMDNEYSLGTTTPCMPTPMPTPLASKAPTVDNINHIGKNNSEEDYKVNVISKQELQQAVDDEDGRSAVKDRPEQAQLFSFLQILTAVFGAFAHGGNDVSNAIGPLVSLWLIGVTGVAQAKAATPIWILFYGGAGISIGLWIWGRRVIKTLGEDLTRITPSSGFCIEIGSALTVLIASNIGIPISTTHCKVGSVVFVGRFRARENVDWSVFRNIVLAWLVTLPVAGGISAAMMAGLRLAV